MSDPLSAKDDLRGAYNQFVKSPAGGDLLAKMVAYETNLMIQAYAEAGHEKKAQAIDKASGIYWVRTLLEDLSKPKSTPVSTGKRTQPRRTSS